MLDNKIVGAISEFTCTTNVRKTISFYAGILIMNIIHNVGGWYRGIVKIIIILSVTYYIY